MALKTPISVLQELMVSKRKALPDYIFESVGDQLNPQFCCTVNASSVTSIAIARNKKEAKQKAAANALQQLQKFDDALFSQGDVKSKTDTPNRSISETSVLKEPPKDYRDGVNYVGTLNDYATNSRCLTAVRYEDSPIVGSGEFQVSCIFDLKKTFGYARVKKQAKQIAAFEMLKNLESSKHISTITQSLIESRLKDMEMDKKAMVKFEQLSPSGIISAGKNGNVEPCPEIKEETCTLEEATEKLKKLNMTHHVVTIQESPYIVAVQLNENQIAAVGTGEDRAIATANAINRVLSALGAGCSFTN